MRAQANSEASGREGGSAGARTGYDAVLALVMHTDGHAAPLWRARRMCIVASVGFARPGARWSRFARRSQAGPRPGRMRHPLPRCSVIDAPCIRVGGHPSVYTLETHGSGDSCERRPAARSSCLRCMWWEARGAHASPWTSRARQGRCQGRIARSRRRLWGLASNPTASEAQGCHPSVANAFAPICGTRQPPLGVIRGAMQSIRLVVFLAAMPPFLTSSVPRPFPTGVLVMGPAQERSLRHALWHEPACRPSYV